jgi:predicted methyltransferase MtxX (methanogen marker protein 4)
MPMKPVGVDENSRFPTRVRVALAAEFVTKPAGIRDGQVPVWNASTGTWIAGALGSGDNTTAPAKIDGGGPA